jgi:hypothetical protein
MFFVFPRHFWDRGTGTCNQAAGCCDPPVGSPTFSIVRLDEHTQPHQHRNGGQSSNRIHVHALDGSSTGTDSYQGFRVAVGMLRLVVSEMFSTLRREESLENTRWMQPQKFGRCL